MQFEDEGAWGINDYVCCVCGVAASYGTRAVPMTRFG